MVDVGVVAVAILEPGNNVVFQHRLLLVAVDLDGHVHEQEWEFGVVVQDAAPDHH